MENLSKDSLTKLALELELPDLLNLCLNHKEINRKVCANQDFWGNKLDKDFPDYRTLKDKSFTQLSAKDKYKLLYHLNILREKLGIEENVYQLYEMEELGLSYGLKEIPKEIGYLHNLKKLYLAHNKLREIPKEIGKLHNLEALLLSDNKLERIPPEIGNLQKLQVLDLYENRLREIPEEIGQLHNLHSLYLRGNRLTELPNSIRKLKLKELDFKN